MRKIESSIDVVKGVLKSMETTGFTPSDSILKGKVVIDVGCGTGDLVRQLSTENARVIGFDSLHMLAKAKVSPSVGNEIYISAVGQDFPLKSNYADLIVFFASLHHVPVPFMSQAIKEVHRVLVPGGTAIFVEPVGEEGSYFEIVRLVEDEREIQRLAYDAMQNGQSLGLENKIEEFQYIERSFDDYIHCLQVFVDDEKKRNECISEARMITEKLSRAAKVKFEDFRYKSIVRLNALQKVHYKYFASGGSGPF